MPNQGSYLILNSTGEVGKGQLVTKHHALGLIIDLEIHIFGIPRLSAVAVSVPFDYSPGSLRVGEGDEEESSG